MLPHPFFSPFIRAVCAIYYILGLLPFLVKHEYYSDKKLKRDV